MKYNSVGVKVDSFSSQSRGQIGYRMRLFRAFSFAILLLSLTAVASQNFNINCNFVMTNQLYTCQISGIILPDNENANINIGGQHIPGMNNNQVQRVQIFFALTPIIIPQIFTTFQNLRELSILSVGLTRIQPNAFANAGSLTHLGAIGNPQFTTIPQNAFTGSNLISLDLFGNSIEFIHENAFNGIPTLEEFVMDQNFIRQFPVNVFLPLPRLNLINFSDNPLGSIDGRIFANHPNLQSLLLTRCGINAIGRNFLDGMPNLGFLNLVGNLCINEFFVIHGTVTPDVVRQRLSTCFDNSGDGPPAEDERRFGMELRGGLVLRHMNGSEIVRL